MINKYIYNLELLKKSLIISGLVPTIGDERQHSCMLTKYGNTFLIKDFIRP